MSGASSSQIFQNAKSWELVRGEGAPAPQYFKTHISEDGAWDDMDISVHCDVYIFQWLMAYIHRPAEGLLGHVSMLGGFWLYMSWPQVRRH